MSRTRSTKLTAIAASLALATAALAGCSASDSNPAASASPGAGDPTPTGPAPAVSKDDTLAAKVPQAIKDSGKLTVATDPGSAPMVFGDIADPQGVDPDLARAVATTLGLEASFTQVPFAQIRDNVAAGSNNVGWSVTTVTNERLKLTDFATYYDSGKAWIVKNGSTFNPNDYCGQQIASIQGYLYTTEAAQASAACKAAGKAEIGVQVVQSANEGRDAVTSGAVAAFPVDSPIAESMIATSGDALAQAGETTQVAPLGAVIEKNSQLGPLVRDAIQKLIDGGQYKQIVERWQVPSGAITNSKFETGTIS